MQDSLFAELFVALDIVVMERLSPGVFRLAGSAPVWLAHFYRQPTLEQDSLRPGDMFPFLAHFLVDAEQFWDSNHTGPLQSGPWEEIDASGREHYFEATAVCLNAHKLLLLAFPKTAYEEKHAIIQKARENSLAYARFNKELLQKEVLLHCIVHDLSGPLTSIMLGLSLLDSESFTPAGQKTVEICMLQATRQKVLIQQILDVFAAEVGAIETTFHEPAQAPDLLACAQIVVDALRPVCIQNQIALQVTATLDTAADWRVVGEPSRLERVLYNLAENAIRHSPRGTGVSMHITEEESGVLVTVDDAGLGVPAHLIDTIFDKFSQARAQPGKAGLGLYFCRITIEGWGGTIGYLPRPSGGAQFWFRLPRPTPMSVSALT